MKTDVFTFIGHKNTDLPAILWLPEGEITMVMQITHGMTEHIGRYESFAQDMTAQGIAVAGFDLRGHGQNPGSREVASFGENGWEASLQDIHLFFELLHQRFPNIPHYMLGFSLGSFLLREYLGRWPEAIHGAIIMGTGHQHALVLSGIMALVNGQIKKAGFDHTTDLVRQLSFGTYNQKFKPNRTQSDWLCTNERALDAYLADPLVRRNISSGLFWQLLDAMKRTESKGTYDNWNKNLPILLISGQDDPVGDGGKGAQAVKKSMKQAGIANVSLHLLPGARHMVLEDSPEESRSIILNWLVEQSI